MGRIGDRLIWALIALQACLIGVKLPHLALVHVSWWLIFIPGYIVGIPTLFVVLFVGGLSFTRRS